MEKSGQNYGPSVEMPPDPLMHRLADADELSEIRLDQLIARKMRLVWKHRRTMRWFLAVGLLLSIVVGWTMQKWFDSTVRLMPPDSTSTAMQMMGAMSSGSGAGLGLAASLLGAKTPGMLYVAALGTHPVLDALIDQFGLMKLYGTKSREQARKTLWGMTDASEDRKTGIITITVSGPDPQTAQRMANAYVEQLTKVINAASNSQARRERLFLEARLEQIKKEWDDSAQQFSQFASKNVALDIPAQTKATMGAAARMQGELVAAQSELEGLEQIFTPNNVRVRSTRARIEELKKQLHATSSDADSVPGGGFSESLGQTIRNLPKLGVPYAELYRKLMVNEAVYEALTKQLEFAKVQEAKDVPPVTVLEPASIPEKKSHPHRSLVLLFGLTVSFLLGFGWISAKEYWSGLDSQNEVKLYIETRWSTLRTRRGDKLHLDSVRARDLDNGNGSGKRD